MTVEGLSPIKNFRSIALAFLVVAISCSVVFADSPRKAQRIISMSPAITEILFELGVGHRIAGITDFCNYPEATSSIPRIGGLLNPNLESIVALKPDLIIYTKENRKIQEQTENLGIKMLKVDLINIENILKSILVLGNILETTETAQPLHDRLKQGIDLYRSKLDGQRRKSTLIVLGKADDPLRDLYGAGKGTFLDELLTMAGGDNILNNSMAIYPKLSKEFVIAQSPEVIIEAIPRSQFPLEEQLVHKARWQLFSTIRAVKDDNVHFVAYDYILIPGPRLLKIVDALAKAIHPKLFLDSKQPDIH